MGGYEEREHQMGFHLICLCSLNGRHGHSTKSQTVEILSGVSVTWQRTIRPAGRAAVADPQLVIAGKMSVEDAPCNIAQFNLKNQEWSLTERIQLSLYNSYSGGEVYSLLANHTNQVYDDSGPNKDTSR